MATDHLAGQLSALLATVFVSASNFGADKSDPLHFFEGKTESASTLRITMQKPVISRSVGQGRIQADGSLDLVQHVDESGRRKFDRRWQIHQVRPGHFTGTMSDAIGPVTIERIGARYRFRFAMKGHLSAEEWLTPEGEIARTQLTVRKFGIAVAHSDGWIRRVR